MSNVQPHTATRSGVKESGGRPLQSFTRGAPTSSRDKVAASTKRPVFVITIDTEGDNIWSCPQTVTTENAKYLPRFQSLCEQYGFKVTYLVNYEMAIDTDFQKFGGDVLKRQTAEIGLHVHSWNSPPLADLQYDPRWHHAYLYECSDELIDAKVDYLTRLLTSVFDVHPRSHRAGRWGFNERVARALAQHGYLADCSVTPGVSWRRYKGAPSGHGGPDYFGFGQEPYFLDLDNIQRSGDSQLLEVPVTIRANYPLALQRFHHVIENGFAGKVCRRVLGSPHKWFRPNRSNIDAMLSLVDEVIEQQSAVLEFMLHSSELMPGGSPTFRTAADVERLYQDLERLFTYIDKRGISGKTLAEYRSTWG